VGSPLRLPQKAVLRTVTTAPWTDTVVLDENKHALVEVCVEPDTEGTLFYGTYLPNRQIRTPFFLGRVAGTRGKEGERRLRFVIPTRDLENGQHDVAGFRRNKGGLVVYRLILRGPWGVSMREGRFGYREGRRVPAVVEGPWVDCLGQRSAVIWFRTDMPCRSRVLVGERTLSTGEEVTLHHLAVGGLTPGKEYRYRVEPTGGVPTRTFRFQTSPVKEVNYDFAFMGLSAIGPVDPTAWVGGVNRHVLGRLTQEALHRGARFIVFGGGFSSLGGAPDAYRRGLQAFKEAVEPVGALVPIYECMGQGKGLARYHLPGRKAELSTAVLGKITAESIFAEEFVNPQARFPYPEVEGAPSYRENTYFFDYGNVRVIVLNTSYWACSEAEKYGGNLPGYILDRQFIWLQLVLCKALASDKIDHVFVVGHHPAFPNGGKVFDGPWCNGGKGRWGTGKGEDRRYAVKRRDEVWEALAANPKVVAALFGGEGNYSRLLVRSSHNRPFTRPLWHINSGGAGQTVHAQANWVPWFGEVARFSSGHHVCIVHIRGMRVLQSVYTDTGELIERVRLR